jgi:hypothetical protein
MPHVRLEHRLKALLEKLLLSAPMKTIRFCSESDIIVEVATDGDAMLLCIAAMMLCPESEPKLLD